MGQPILRPAPARGCWSPPATEPPRGRERLKKTINMLFFRARWLRGYHYGLAAGMLLLLPLKDTRLINAQAQYDRASEHFLHGFLEKSQQEADQGYRLSLPSNPELAWRFQLLEAEAMLRRGMYEDALRVLSAHTS